MKSPRFWVVLLLLVAAFTTLHLRASVDRVPPSEPPILGCFAGGVDSLDRSAGGDSAGRA